EIYDSMDGYDSPVTRQTVADEEGQFEFRDLPSGEKAYWLRAGREGFGGTTAWFVTVSDEGPAKAEVHLIGSPRHDIWIDSADVRETNGFKHVEDLQCFGGSRIEVKESRPAGERAEWWAEFEFEAPRAGSHVPHFAAGLYPTPHYWSDYWWSIDGSGPHRASETLTIEGPRYGDRATMVWAFGPARYLKKGKHTLTVILRDPAPHEPVDDTKAYWWSFDAAALAEAPALVWPVGGEKVATATPELRWDAPESASRFAVQYSEEADFSNGTVTVGGVRGSRLRLKQRLADGKYYWRVKALTEEETPFTSAFTAPARFVVATEAPAMSDVRVTSRGPNEAVIEWRTDEPCTSRLRYGLSALEFTRSAEASDRPRKRHSVRLSGLAPMTYYYYAAEATDRDGHIAQSLRRGFCTPRGVIADENSPFGMFGQGLMYARQMGEAGVKWYSDYWMWRDVEPSRGTFNWEQPEERMKRAEEAGVRLMVTFWGTPAWTRPSHPVKFTYGPDDLQDARDFFREVAAHCAGRTYWWLPWIEPNVARDTTFGFPEGYWANRPHARSYVAYQRAAYEGAKAGDPECRVVGMNTAGVDLAFIRKCYDEGAADTFDVMNVHYYAVAAPFERQHPERVFAQLRALMAEYGDAEKPILCSEGGGASSNLEGTNEETQADNLIRIYVISIANNIDKLCWTFERDVKPYDSTRVDMIMWMGLFRFDPDAKPDNPVGEPKPAYFALKAMTEQLEGTEYVGPVKARRVEGADAPVRAYRFAGESSRVTVAWAEEGEAEMELPVKARRVTVVNREGERRTEAASGGVVRLRLTGSPVFVREDTR
ncbi:MAG: fibronectin type III domain-containing protein, partial [Armatimonadota bacterium]